MDSSSSARGKSSPASSHPPRYNAHAAISFREVRNAGPPVRPLDFPPPKVRAGVRVNALVVHPSTGSRQVCSGVIHREDLSSAFSAPRTNNTVVTPTTTPISTPSPQRPVSSTAPGSPVPHLSPSASPIGSGMGSSSSPKPPDLAAVHNTALTESNDTDDEILAYWPQRRLQDAIYGSVWACLVLRRHFGVAADDAARAAGVEPGSAAAPMVWEITGAHVAIKMIEWARVHHMRGRLLEDPVKEVAAMQMLGGHPNVLSSSEVLQDSDFLYSIMPFCRDGDLFGIVVKYAEDSGGEIGMPEPVARYWFRQILSGLHHLQHMGVCHRDLSLENVLVDHDRCFIMDMGMCLRVPYTDPTDPIKIVDVTCGAIRRLMKPQGVCGKHNYMSPEIAANTEAFDGFSIDLWAAGVILYIMLTGFPPYDQANRTDQRFELIITGRLMEQLKNWDIHLSDDAGDLMQKMLQYHPKNRLSLAQVMDHPWVTNDDVEIPEPEEPTLRFS